MAITGNMWLNELALILYCMTEVREQGRAVLLVI